LSNRIHVLGSPGSRVGGASGECIGAIQIWRKNGLDVAIHPTWQEPQSNEKEIAKELGCEIKFLHPRSIGTCEDLRGAIVVSFCNDRVAIVAQQLKKQGCRVIFAPCMCYPENGISTLLRAGVLESVVFQSKYQMGQMERRLATVGYNPNMGHLIRGYYDWPSVEFKPRVRETGEPFVAGRIARAAANKWSKDWWKMYERIPNRKAILLGYSTVTRKQIGKPPEWAEVVAPGGRAAESVYEQLHAFVTCNGGAEENWPRTGLEAMACGVPIVAENKFGWAEMIEHEQTGLLGGTWEEIGDQAARLESDEELRISLAKNARERLSEICNQDEIWEGWRKVFYG
jgi:glycosyltransferase involved in cell wall biosynthesis